jgi:hypothetical protein
MKKIILTSILALLIPAGLTIKAQDRADDYLGLPGDNLNLYAVMNLFQESRTLEDFERSLNDPDTKVNNLDLNGDGYVDYISVNDYVDGNVHTIVMQDALGPREKQDVGVFTVERFRDGSVQIQLIGDEALYGRNYIIEPNYDTPNPGYRANRYARSGNTYIEVSAWPMVRFIFNPGYVVWHSTWSWGYYPVYWHPWTPFYYHYYYGYHHSHDNYYSYYRHVNVPRYARYNDYYFNHVRSYSPTVVVNINKGHYKNTYSRPQSRREGEAVYAREHSSRSSNLSNRQASQRRNTGETMSRNNNQRSQQIGRSSSGQNRNEAGRARSSSSERDMNVRSSSPNNQRNISSSSSNNQRTQSVRQSSGNQGRSVVARPAERNSGSASQVRSSSRDSGQRRTATATQSGSKGSSSARQSAASKAPERRQARSGGNETKSSGKTAQAKSSESKSRR